MTPIDKEFISYFMTQFKEKEFKELTIQEEKKQLDHCIEKIAENMRGAKYEEKATK